MKPIHLISILAVLLLAGCGTLTLRVDPISGTPTSTAPAPTRTGPVPTAQPPASTDPAPAPTATADPGAVQVTKADLMVAIVLIAVDDNGQSGVKTGCGDSAVPVQVQIPYTQGLLRAALERLLALKDQYYGQSGLYNALYQSDLRLEGVAIQDGAAAIDLSGTLKLGGECDNPRVEAQLTQTALQFPTVTSVAITLNGKPLKDALSLK